MKYLINISVDISSNLSLENCRGEGRWERNTLNALLKSNKPVHTTRHIWKTTEPKPDNLYDGLNESWVKESVLLVHSAGRKLYVERDDARGYVLQFHEVAFGPAKEELLRYSNEKRLIGTLASQAPYIYNQLSNIIGTENIVHMAGAMVPHTVDDADNFRKPNVTWSYRNFQSFMEESPSDMIALFDFLSPYLSQDPEMRIAILVGMWDTTRFGHTPSNETIRDWALNFPVMSRFKHLFNRIDFYINLHWSEVLKLLSETRWIISPAEPLGCPAYEAAMFGIPTIVNKDINPFITLNGGSLFPELLTSSRNVSTRFISLLDKLQNDHQFYLKTGEAYRKYTRENATFKAYVNQLDRIVTERGWNL